MAENLRCEEPLQASATGQPNLGAAAKPGTKATLVERGHTPLLVGAEDAAALCGVSSAFWRQLDSEGRAPAAIKLGSRRLWSIDTLKAWIAGGCPKRGPK